jgi:enoyl-CoA hydratase
MYETLLYGVADGIATITLNRPERLNTIVPPMPDEFEAAVTAAVRDDDVKVIVLRGAGRSFCAGYDFAGDSTTGTRRSPPGGSGIQARTSSSPRRR